MKYNATIKRVRVTTVAVKRQEVVGITIAYLWP